MIHWTYRLGALFYLLWGLLHLYAASRSFVIAAGLEAGDVQSKVQQNGWDLAVISLLTITVAVLWNRRNGLAGYVLNGLVVSATDIGFLVLIYVPGHSDDILGPILWLLALLLSTIGILRAPRTA